MLLKKLRSIWQNVENTVFIDGDERVRFSDITSQSCVDVSKIKTGDVVALIGDFSSSTIFTLLRLLDLAAIVVPLTETTESQHDYFFESALVDVVIKDGKITRRVHKQKDLLIDQLRAKQNAGLIFFSSGTTGKPKAVLHDFTQFIKRFDTPKPSLRIMSFLLFDHIGGINTLFHALFSKGTVVVPSVRTVDGILRTCEQHQVEVLPTTPTFLRMLLISSSIPCQIPSCLKIITYGTELMDQSTLDSLCTLLPNIDFRQTFGLSELGIMRVKSESRNSLYMELGGEGIETSVNNKVLHIRSKFRMLGYLNASTPFDDNGWYNTNDIVERKEHYYKIVGRQSEIINVGGLKFMASDIECVALKHPDVALVKVHAKTNPITGQHVEISIQLMENKILGKKALIDHFQQHLQTHMVPRRIKFETIHIGHRFKKS